MELRACVWTREDERWLDARLASVNGRRTARTLSREQVQAAAARALTSPRTPVVVHGGDVEDGRQLTSLCLCVADERGVVVGLGTSRTRGASPARAFADLEAWDAWTPTANVVRAEQWAERRAPDRRRLALERAPDGPDALLASIRAAPDDDAPRLVYADWLSERGDPRGEFIAVQCALARPELERAQRLALEAREVSLLSQHGAAWLGPLAADAVRASFSRGFLEALTVLDVDALDAAAETLGREPLRALVFATGRRVDVARVLAWPWLDSVRSLDLQAARGLEAPLGREGLEALLTTRRLRGLTALGFTGQGLGDAGAARLGASRAFPRLRALTLTVDRVTGDGLRALARAPWFTGLERLALTDNELGPLGAEVLAATPFKRLTRLTLSKNRLGTEGAVALARSPHLATVRSLWLSSNRIGQTGAEALLEAPTLRAAELVLLGNPIGARLRQRLLERDAPHEGRPTSV